MYNIDKQLFANFIENTTDGIFVIGYDGTIRMDNSVASEILGLEDDLLYGKTMVELITRDERNDQFFECIIESVYNKQKISKVTLFHRGDKKLYLRLVVSPLRDRLEDIAAVVMFSDITELVILADKNHNLNERLLKVLNNFVTTMIDAVDTRSPYNATHTKKMVKYATAYIEYLEKKGENLPENEKMNIVSSVWLHDLGKLVIPLEVLDKPSRLADKEEDVFHRIEVAILCERIRILENSDEGDEAREKIKKLEEVSEFIKKINVAGFIDDETIEKVKEIADIQCIDSKGEIKPLLNDYEREALMIQKGTLTDDERKIVQSHVVHTSEMLKKMEFEGDFAEIPEWAGMHHEYLDGTGYPNGIKGDEIPWQVRFITIIDIYDALTADDRPYKPPMTPEKAFGILRSMCNEGKLDRDILEDFIASEAWK